MGKQNLSITGRLLIVAQAMWAFIALFVAVEMSDGLLYTLIGFIALCVPVWAFYGIRWTLALQRLPLWTLALFLLSLALAISPFLFNDYRYDDNYAPFYLLAAPLAFFLFRYLHNRQYATQTAIEDIFSCASGCLDFLRRHSHALKNGVYGLLIIIVTFFSIQTVNDFVKENRPASHKEKFSQQELASDKGLREALSSGYDRKDCFDLEKNPYKRVFNFPINVGLKKYCDRVIAEDNNWDALPFWNKFMLAFDNWHNGESLNTKHVQNTGALASVTPEELRRDHPEYIKAATAEASKADLESCLMSLQGIADEIEAINPAYNSSLARGLGGWISMNYNNSDEPVTKTESKWGSAGLQTCKKFGAPDSKIVLLESAMNNSLPENPLDLLSECALGLYVISHYQYQYHGFNAGFEMEKAFGQKVGGVVSDLTYLYKSLESRDPIALSVELNKEVSDQYQRLLPQTTFENYESKIAPLVTQCSIFGIGTTP